MGTNRRALLGWLGGAGCASADPDAALTVLVDGSIELPQAQIVGGRVVGGLQHELAVEIARRLGRTVSFRLLPRRRVPAVLAEGRQADLICNYLPAWLPGPLLWSRPHLDDGDLLITAARQPAPRFLQELAGQPIGTIAGYLYPEVEAALGAGFLRDDAPNLVASLQKLAAGRMNHALVGKLSFEYMRRHGELPLELHPPLLVAMVRTRCALPANGRVTLPELDAALDAMRADGSLQRIVDHYR